MSMRDEIIQKMFELTDDSDEGTTKAFNKAYLIFESDLSASKKDEYAELLTDMEYAAFFAGAKCMWSFMTGKE